MESIDVEAFQSGDHAGLLRRNSGASSSSPAPPGEDVVATLVRLIWRSRGLVLIGLGLLHDPSRRGPSDTGTATSTVGWRTTDVRCCNIGPHPVVADSRNGVPVIAAIAAAVDAAAMGSLLSSATAY